MLRYVLVGRGVLGVHVFGPLYSKIYMISDSFLTTDSYLSVFEVADHRQISLFRAIAITCPKLDEVMNACGGKELSSMI